MLSLLRQCGAEVLPSNSRVRRRRTSSPPQGPPASRPVGGLRTFRDLRGSDIKIRAALHPQSAQPPATSAWWLVSKKGGMRGRKVPVRGPSVLCEIRALACSLSAMRGVRRLMRQRRGSAQSQTPPVLASSPGSVCARSSKVEFNLAAIPPGLVSLRLRKCQVAFEQQGCSAPSTLACLQLTKPSGRPGGSRPGCWRSGCIKVEAARPSSRKHPLRGSARVSVVASYLYSTDTACSRGRLYPAPTSYRAHKVGRPGPGR